MNLCERFTTLTPLALRKEKAREVFLLVKRYGIYSKKESRKKNNKGKQIIRRPAGDTWF